MGQTLCADLRCNPILLEELDKTLSVAEWVGHTTNAIVQYYLPDADSEDLSTMTQLRDQFFKVVKDLTTSDAKETTIAEEWPVALEFNGWASDDCVGFCNSRGLIDDLRKCRKALNNIFSNINKSFAELDHYQEIETDEEGHVVIRLEIESDRRTYRNEYKSWVSWMVDSLKDENRALVSISIDRI